MERRTILKGTISISILTIAASAGLLSPRSVLAVWPKKAFFANKIRDAVKNVMGASSMTTNNVSIRLTTPPIAENGAQVGVSVSTTLPNVDSVSILVKTNNLPLAANFMLKGQTNVFIRTRVKVGKSSDIIAVVRSNGKLFMTKRNVKVTRGGCGG